jgi:selenocysteine-specific elongation factor
MHVVSTAGHVDHGKSTLVLALTGIDPDRLAEEKQRGLTIDLGFASATLPSGRELSFVDVPGHVRFLKNMLAGVGAVDACLFVVAATEGWKPQSEEHLRILELVGVERGVVALTKVDSVDSDQLELVELMLAEHLAGTFLASAPVVHVAAPTNLGMTELRAALDQMLSDAPAPTDRGRPRLWVDRVFAARGSGTVVTGTLTGGSLDVDEPVVITPRGIEARVRGLQTLHRSVETIGPGNRVAINLAGVAHDAIGRGNAVVSAGRWHLTQRFDASLTVLTSIGHNVSRRGSYFAYIGSGEHPAKLRVLGSESIRPGKHGLIRLHLGSLLPLVPGDRFVLRESGRNETVGGGEVLDVAPVRPASKATPDRSVDRVVAERGWITAGDLERLTGETREPSLGPWVGSSEALHALRNQVLDRIARAGQAGLDVASLDDRERLILDALDTVTVTAGRARHRAEPDRLADHPLLAALADAPFAPPAPEGVGGRELREMVQRGLVVERDGIYFAPSAVAAAALVAARLLAAEPGGFTASAMREALGTSRKYVLPLLNELDATGVTRRRDDLRVAGPRLPAI